MNLEFIKTQKGSKLKTLQIWTEILYTPPPNFWKEKLSNSYIRGIQSHVIIIRAVI